MPWRDWPVLFSSDYRNSGEPFGFARISPWRSVWLSILLRHPPCCWWGGASRPSGSKDVEARGRGLLRLLWLCEVPALSGNQPSSEFGEARFHERRHRRFSAGYSCRRFARRLRPATGPLRASVAGLTAAPQQVGSRVHQGAGGRAAARRRSRLPRSRFGRCKCSRHCEGGQSHIRSTDSLSAATLSCPCRLLCCLAAFEGGGLLRVGSCGFYVPTLNNPPLSPRRVCLLSYRTRHQKIAPWAAIPTEHPTSKQSDYCSIL